MACMFLGIVTGPVHLPIRLTWLILSPDQSDIAKIRHNLLNMVPGKRAVPGFFTCNPAQTDPCETQFGPAYEKKSSQPENRPTVGQPLFIVKKKRSLQLEGGGGILCFSNSWRSKVQIIWSSVNHWDPTIQMIWPFESNSSDWNFFFFFKSAIIFFFKTNFFLL